MALAAKISSTEVSRQINEAYVDQFFEIALLYNPGVTYQPGITNDTTFLATELSNGVAGYKRQIIGYTSADVANYADKGIGLARKAAVFTQDGGGTALTFSHIAVLRGDGNILTVNTPSSTPSAALDGTYTSLPATTSGTGQEALFDLTISSTGTVFSLVPSYPGFGYAVSDTITILEADLVTAGAVSVGAGDLVASVATVTTGNNTIYSVSKPNSEVNITDGNQLALYFDIKHFGFFN